MSEDEPDSGADEDVTGETQGAVWEDSARPLPALPPEDTSDLPTIQTLAPLDSEVPSGGTGGTITVETVWPDVGGDAEGDEKYRFVGEIGRGGMGAIYKVVDRRLHRQLAMKVLLHQKANESRPQSDGGEPDLLQRFLEEAQVTAQLDHPGVVAVHELGTDTDGSAFFTMNLVRGDTLSAIFKLARKSAEGWNTPRALAVLQRVCETVAFAHSKGVIHRDLKPANVMVGKFGEVYVMDWGLAKLRDKGTETACPDGPTHPEDRAVPEIRTIRSHDGDVDAQSPETLAGRAMGTPGFMPPEQAAGRLDQVDAQSDVYALGAMLYQLLAGHPPYMPPGFKGTPWIIIKAVLDHPPEPLESRAPGTPPELVSICEKAMARHKAERYASAAALGEDLQSFLSGHVVRAHKTGPMVELRKWVARNKAVAATAAGALLVIAVLTGAFLRSLQEQRDLATRQRDRAVTAEVLANERFEEAEAERAAKARALEDVLRLADTKHLSDLRSEADTLWPIHPDSVPRMREWLDKTNALVQNLPDHRKTLEQLESSALEWTDEARERDRATHAERLADVERRLAAATDALERERLVEAFQAIESEADTRSTWHFASEQLAWQHEVLSRLVQGVETLSADGTGLLARVRTRKEAAETLAKRTLVKPADLWGETIALIADRDRSPRYDGLRIEPQLGLIPLGKDPGSGLFEFAHAGSGDVPQRDSGSGELVLTDGSAVVLVLIPGAETWIGAQGRDADGPNYDPEAQPAEGPVHRVTLSPYFLAKHECTQAQWRALTGGETPSGYRAGLSVSGRTITQRNPVENVTWDECVLWLGRHGLELPSEAQWENACRAESPLRWSGADEPRSLQANVADEYLRTHGGPQGWPYSIELDDGHGVHAPVGSYRANGFGLHDMHGNVWEWCRDGFKAYSGAPANDPLVEPGETGRSRVLRGGGWNNTAFLARSANRVQQDSNVRDDRSGVRAARMLHKR